MPTKHPPPSDIDSYITAFRPEVRARLKKVRATIRKAAPDAIEKISYRMPAFALCGSLVCFAAFENHIGFYPGASGVSKFARRLRSFHYAKGSVQFPHDRPIPFGLIADIVAFRVAENLERVARASKASRTARRGPRRGSRTT
jgi:uncharacterized protein YdhG (YjbR/CyaY superfamily)